MPSVSIIIPAYNPGRYLAQAIDSVIAQTFTDWEMVVVDDGSTEDISWVRDKHPSIRLIQQENRGLSIARNVAILASTGEFIAFLDADDLWEPDKLAKQVAVMDSCPRVGLCHTLTQYVDAAGHRLDVYFDKATDSYYDLLKICSVVISSSIIRRECLAVASLFDPMYIHVQDYDMWLKIAKYYDLNTIMSVETLYRVHGNNMSKDYSMVHSEVSSLLRRHLGQAYKSKDQVAIELLKKGLYESRVGSGCKAFGSGIASLKEKDIFSCINHFAHALRLAPKYTLKTVISFPYRRSYIR